MKYVIVNLTPDYNCYEFFGGSWCHSGTRAVWGHSIQIAKVYDSKEKAKWDLDKMFELRKRFPTWWHYSKAKGGYGLDKMSIVTLNKAKKLSDAADEKDSEYL